ncbi:hypothetical protein BF14_024390 [Streptomyces griseus]|nr:hypothetical protein BF14_024390 [Streptomyces griseus]
MAGALIMAAFGAFAVAGSFSGVSPLLAMAAIGWGILDPCVTVLSLSHSSPERLGHARPLRRRTFTFRKTKERRPRSPGCVRLHRRNGGVATPERILRRSSDRRSRSWRFRARCRPSRSRRRSGAGTGRC